MRILYANEWMYVIEIREATPTQEGQYFTGSKVRGYICRTLEEAMNHMALPDVSKDNLPIPDDIQKMIEDAQNTEEAAATGRRSKAQLHEHISERLTQRKGGVWPLVSARIRKLMGKNGAIEQPKDTKTIEEIYDEYL